MTNEAVTQDEERASYFTRRLRVLADRIDIGDVIVSELDDHCHVRPRRDQAIDEYQEYEPTGEWTLRIRYQEQGR